MFQRSVRQCIQAGLVSGETVHIDATLTRANVSWDSYSERHAEKVLQENPLEESNPEGGPSCETPEALSAGHATRRRSLTDPDATLATTQRNRRLMPAYKQHLAVDDQAGVILDLVTTTGCANEGEQILAQVDRVQRLLPARIHSITADAGYAYGKVYAGLEERRIQAVIPAKREWCNKNVIPLKRFKYDGRHHIVRCPRGKILTRSCKTKHGWYYRSACSDCSRCDLRARCLSRNSSNRRTVVISDGYEALLRARRAKGRWTPERNRAYYRHRWRSEGVNSEAKRIHGLHRAVRRRQSNVEIQTFLTGSAINLKRLAA